MKSPHGLHGQRGDAVGVEQGMPALLHLLEGEPAGEVDPQVDGCQIIGLLHCADEHQVVGGSPSPQVLDTSCCLYMEKGE